MATHTSHTRAEHRRPPRGWDTEPVVSGRRHRPLVVALLAGAALVVVAGLVVLLTPDIPGTRGPRAPAPAPVVAPPRPFTVDLVVTDVATMDNDRLFGGTPAGTGPGVVRAAARSVERVIARYLTAAFVTPASRFSARPVRALVSDVGAVPRRELRGLGVLEVTDQRVDAGPVDATARVVTRDGAVAMVAVRYDARARLADRTDAEVRQRASLVFTPQRGGWRATAVDATLTVPDALVPEDRR